MTATHDALRAMLEKATPGPWEWHMTPFDCDLLGAGGRTVLTSIQSAVSVNEADAEMIVAAVNSLPALLAENEALREALEFYSDDRRWHGENNPPIANDPYAPEPDFPFCWSTGRDRGEIARAALAKAAGGDRP